MLLYPTWIWEETMALTDTISCCVRRCLCLTSLSSWLWFSVTTWPCLKQVTVDFQGALPVLFPQTPSSLWDDGLGLCKIVLYILCIKALLARASTVLTLECFAGLESHLRDRWVPWEKQVWGISSQTVRRSGIAVEFSGALCLGKTSSHS